MRNWVRIISDGTPQGTRILNNDGVDIPGVISASWMINSKDLAVVTLVLCAEVDIQGPMAEDQLELEGV